MNSNPRLVKQAIDLYEKKNAFDPNNEQRCQEHAARVQEATVTLTQYLRSEIGERMLRLLTVSCREIPAGQRREQRETVNPGHKPGFQIYQIDYLLTGGDPTRKTRPISDNDRKGKTIKEEIGISELVEALVFDAGIEPEAVVNYLESRVLSIAAAITHLA